MKRIIALILIVLAGTALAACTPNDPPPKEDTPDPAPLSGVFRCGASTFIFSGDDTTVTVNVDSELAAQTGLPAGEHQGTYVFLLYNGKYRYDKADIFRITLDGKAYQFNNTLGTTNSDTVAFSTFDGSSVLTFHKVKEG